MAPSKDEIRVATNELRSQAGEWAALERPLTTNNSLATRMQLSGVEMGIFAPLYAPYSALLTKVAQMCQTGSEQMVAVADTLQAVATTYDNEESRNVHLLESLY